MAGRLQPQLPRRGAVEQPAGQPPAVDQPARPRSPRPRRRTAWSAGRGGRCGSSTDDDRRRRTAPPPRGRAGSWSCGRSPGRSIAPSRWPIRLPPTRGSNSTGIVPLGELGRDRAAPPRARRPAGRSPRARRDRHNGGRCGWHSRAACRRPSPAITLADAAIAAGRIAAAEAVAGGERDHGAARR